MQLLYVWDGVGVVVLASFFICAACIRMISSKGSRRPIGGVMVGSKSLAAENVVKVSCESGSKLLRGSGVGTIRVQ